MATNNWNGNDRASAPDVAFGRGYDAVTTGRQATESGINAYLIDNSDKSQVSLTVIAVETDLKLAGSKAQSPLQMDFYARNFTQASFSIQCQARSQLEIGRVAEFVHKAQRSSVSRGSLMTITIPGGGLKGTAASSVNGGNGMRGKRRGLSMSGYVATMPREHKRHDPAPKFVFDFVVAKMHTGIFEDQPYKVYKLAKWSEIVDTVLEGNFISPPTTVEQDQQAEALREAADAIKSIPFLGDLLDGG